MTKKCVPYIQIARNTTSGPASFAALNSRNDPKDDIEPDHYAYFPSTLINSPVVLKESAPYGFFDESMTIDDFINQIPFINSGEVLISRRDEKTKFFSVSSYKGNIIERFSEIETIKTLWKCYVSPDVDASWQTTAHLKYVAPTNNGYNFRDKVLTNILLDHEDIVTDSSNPEGELKLAPNDCGIFLLTKHNSRTKPTAKLLYNTTTKTLYDGSNYYK